MALESETDLNAPADDRTRRAGWLTLGWLAIGAERLFAPLGECALLAGIAAALIGLDVLPRAPAVFHAVVILLFVVAALAIVFRGVRRWRTPDRADAARRLERQAALAHRPLDVPVDRPIQSTPAVDALWARHARVAAAALDRLRTPAPGFDACQPTLWPRAVVVMAAVVGIATGWTDFGSRAERAVDISARWPGPPPPVLDAWIEPPTYTGRPAIRLAAAATAPARADVVAPEGSALTLAIAGLDGPPQVDGDAHVFDAANPAAGAWRMTTTLTQHDIVRWRVGDDIRGDFAVAVSPDAPPEIDFAGPPQRAAGSSALALDYVAEDDYGVLKVVGSVALAPQSGDDAAAFASAADPLPLPFAAPIQRSGEAVTGSGFFDQTGHPWAGLEVLIRLEATDAAGQVGRGPVLRTILPERIFNHLVARALAAARKRLSRDPAARPDVARDLNAIRAQPQRYAGDIVVHMGLSAASARLIRDQDGAGVRSTQDLLWALALRLEDGGVSLAASALRALQRSLLDALSDENFDDAEIDALADALRQALDDYLQALSAQMAGLDPETFEDGALPEGAQVLNGSDLRDMLDRALEMGRAGGRDAARQMLSQLQRMLENLQMGDRNGGGTDPRRREGQAALEDLNRVIEEQSALADRTFRDAERGVQRSAPDPAGPDTPQFDGRASESPRRGPLGAQGSDPGDGAQPGGRSGEGPRPGDGELVQGPPASAGEQSALRDRVDEIMRRFGQAVGQAPDNLGQAGRSMDEATDALGRGAPGAAIGPQADALSALQSGAGEMADALAQGFGQGSGGAMRPSGASGGPDPQGQDSGGRDPFGRRVDGEQGGTFNNEWRGDLPRAEELNRSRALVDEMRRRLGLPNNPQTERDYLRRLLDRF